MVYDEKTFKPGVLIYLPGNSRHEGQRVELFRPIPPNYQKAPKRNILYANTPVLFLDVVKDKPALPPKYLIILYNEHVWAAYNEGYSYGWPMKLSNKRPNWTILKTQHPCLNPDN